MRIVFFGSPASALPSLRGLIEAGHSVELVVTQPDKPAGRGRRLTPSAVKAFALERGLPVLEPARIRKDDSVLPRLREARPDVHVVVAYGQIIPGAIIDFPRRRSLNVHFSLLPKYRGAAPVQWTVLNGESDTGVTVIVLNARMDEGDILAQVRTWVGPRETAAELESRLAVMGARLLLETLGRLDAIVPVPQDQDRATLAPKIGKELGRIAWSEPAAAVDRRVRALADRPGAFTFFRGRRLGLYTGMPLDDRAEGRRPGEIISVGKEGLAVACGDGGAYLIEALQPEGRARMSARDFANGAKVSDGETFGEE
ncbi:MAG TPA: methionyl-tRNA formyltransferase [Terriglobales bacterium]|nr:methionyl-tRNA formyltransferase [Terriglobales bacterium]